MQRSGRHTIVMLDDDVDLLESFRLMFRSCFREVFKFHGFATLDEASAFLRGERCDIVLLDLSMPRGPHENIKQLRQNTTARIVLHSAWHDLREIAADAGADGFLEKPCPMIGAEIHR